MSCFSGGASIAFAQDDNDNSTAVTVNAPTIMFEGKNIINGGSVEHDGNFVTSIAADEGCTLLYKWASKATSAADLKKSTGVTAIDNNTFDIIKKTYTSTRVLSVIAVKEVNGKLYYSNVVSATFVYVGDTKKNLVLAATDFSIDINTTKQIVVTAKDGDNEISGLTYTFTSDNPDIASVDKDGFVKGIMPGNVYITIDFAGNSTYKATAIGINVIVKSNATNTEKGTIFYNIADIRAAGQIKNSIDWILNFTESNPATVVAIFTKDDPDFDNRKGGKGNIFIVDKTGLGLMIPDYSSLNNHDYIKDLKVGDKITGYLAGQYKERQSSMPEFTLLDKEITNGNKKYTTNFHIDTTGETSADGNPEYPINEVKDVNTIANTNPKDGNTVTASYGSYLNTIVSVPGVIRKGAAGNYYLVQDENAACDEDNEDKRLLINTTQIGVSIADYANTTGTFEGILIKRGTQYSKLIVLKDNFYKITKIYLDENDDENRINDLVADGAFDDEVDIYVHRTKLVNTAGAWNTLCFPFDMTAEEFKDAFGCELTALAAPQINGEKEVNGKTTQIGIVNEKEGNLLFETKSDLNIEAGMPYLMKASGTQTAGLTPDGFSYTNTNGSYIDSKGNTKTPQEIQTDTKNAFYAYIGQKLITVVPPHQIQGTLNNKVVNGDFYFRGLYGRKATTDKTEDGTTNNLYDNGSQKYQYISTKDNYLKYLTKANENLKFPGFRAYFYFPNWDAAANDKQQGTTSQTNAKVHLFVEDNSTTGIHDMENVKAPTDNRIYNLAGQVVDSSYKGIVIKNGRKYLAK